MRMMTVRAWHRGKRPAVYSATTANLYSSRTLCQNSASACPVKQPAVSSVTSVAVGERYDKAIATNAVARVQE